MQNWIVKLAAMEGVSLEACRDRMLLYDPLHEGTAHKKALATLLHAAAPVRAGQVLHTALSAQDEALLRAIADECADSMLACMQAADCEGALEHWKLLEAFQVVGHPSTLNPQPSTLNPQPSTLSGHRARVHPRQHAAT